MWPAEGQQNKQANEPNLEDFLSSYIWASYAHELQVQLGGGGVAEYLWNKGVE